MEVKVRGKYGDHTGRLEDGDIRLHCSWNFGIAFSLSKDISVCFQNMQSGQTTVRTRLILKIPHLGETRFSSSGYKTSQNVNKCHLFPVNIGCFGQGVLLCLPPSPPVLTTNPAEKKQKKLTMQGPWTCSKAVTSSEACDWLVSTPPILYLTIKQECQLTPDRSKECSAAAALQSGVLLFFWCREGLCRLHTRFQLLIYTDAHSHYLTVN